MSVVLVFALVATSLFSGISSGATGGNTYTFTETGLSSGQTWTVTVQSSTYHQSRTSSSSQIVFNNVPGGVAWNVSSPNMTTTTSSSSFGPTGSSQNIQVNFSTTYYQVTFYNSIDSSMGAEWSVTLTGTESNGNSFSKTDTQYVETCSFSIPSGSYQWTASDMYETPTQESTTVNSGQIEYVPQPSSGSFSGSVPSMVDVLYSEYSAQIYFYSSGLPSSSTYTVNLNSVVVSASSSQQIDFYVDPGSYTYSYSTNAVGYSVSDGSTPPSGTFTATEGETISYSVGYSDYYNLYFNETGLPPGTEWTLNLSQGGTLLDSWLQSSSNPPPINLQYGTYSYVIPSVGYYHPYPSSGTITMSSTVSDTVRFSEVAPANYSVTFNTQNISSSQEFWVIINGQNETGTGSISEDLFNGTYNYTAGTTGYEDIRGTLFVSGAAESISLDFTKSPPKYTVQFTIEESSGNPIDLSQDSILFNGLNVSSGETIVIAGGEYELSVGTITSGIFNSWSSDGYISITNSNAAVTTADVTSSGGIVMYVAPSSSTTTTYTLSLKSGAGGYITYSYNSVSGTIYSGQSLTLTIDSGTSITLKAFPQSPDVFVSWQGTFGSSGSTLLIGIYENTQETAVFTDAIIPVVFEESGLASGQSWSVTLNGKTNSSTTGSVEFTVAPGTYDYSIPQAGGDSAYPSSGSLSVNSQTTVDVTFVPPGDYAINFHETGLPAGTVWWVDINGQQLKGSTATLQTVLPGNSYQYSVGYSGNLEPRNTTSTITLNSDMTLQVPFYYEFNISAYNGTQTGITIYYYVNQTAFNSITGFSGTMQDADYLYQYLNDVPDFYLYGAKVTVNGNTPSLSSQKDILFRSLLWARAVVEKPDTLQFDSSMATQIYNNYLSKDYVQKVGIALADAVNFLSSSVVSDLLSSFYSPSASLELASMFSLTLEVLTSPSLLQNSSPTEYGGVLGVLSDFGLIPPKAQSYDPTTLMSEISSGNLPSNQFGSFVNDMYSQTSAAQQYNSMSSLAHNTVVDLLEHFLIEDVSETASEKAMPMVTSIASKILSGLGGELPAADTISPSIADSASSTTFIAGTLLFVAHLINQYSVMQSNLLQQQINIASTLYYTVLPDLYNSLLNAYSSGSSTTLSFACLSKTLESTYMQMLTYSLLSTWYGLDYQLLSNQLVRPSGSLLGDQTMEQGTANYAVQIYQLTSAVQKQVPEILNFIDPVYPHVQNLSTDLNISSLSSGFPTKNVVALQFNYSQTNQSYNITVGNRYVEISTFAGRNSTLQGNYPYSMFFTNTLNRTVLLLFSNSRMNVSVSGENISLASVYEVSNNTTNLGMNFESSMGCVQYFSSSPDSNGNETISTYDSSLTINPGGIGAGSEWGISVDNRTILSTGPITVNGLEPGDYVVSFLNGSEYYTNSGSFSVNILNGTVSRSVEYYHYSYISGTVNPPDAILTLNGKPVTVINGSYYIKVPGGNYTLVASENGYVTYYDNFSIAPNVTRDIAISMNLQSSPYQRLIIFSPFLISIIVIAGIAAYTFRKRNKK